MTLRFQPVLVATGEEGEGQLVFWEDHLVAVLVRLSALHDEASGRWFLEAAFGRLDGPAHPTFATLDEARSWIEAALRRPTLRTG
ncbi:hypothetical protein ACFODL_04460 [Phenylobacterium terrae]|uniref:STAS/SEC14 domain-containing protein n=1 Tax=Phenylobacterium terrae TaxID=2665495 RepID=A0ABW4MW30_9CAUL